MNKNTRNVAFFATGIAGLLAILFLWYTYGASPKAGDAPTNSGVGTGMVLLDGRTVADRVADLGFVPSARIASIAKVVGDTVKSGDVLSTVESGDVAAQLSAARADAAAAQSTLESLRNSLKKEKLVKAHLHGNDRNVQGAQVDSTAASVAAEENVVLAALGAARNAEVEFGKTILRAPFDGIVTRQDGEVGEVAGSAVSAFMTLESIGDVHKVEAYASELDIAKMKAGDAVSVGIAVNGATKEFPAHVSVIDPDATDRNGTSAYKVTVLLDGTDSGVRPGMHAGISLAK